MTESKGITEQEMIGAAKRLVSLIPSDHPGCGGVINDAYRSTRDARETIEDASARIAYSRAATQRLRRMLDAAMLRMATALEPAAREAIDNAILNAEVGADQLARDTSLLKHDAERLSYSVSDVDRLADQARKMIAEWRDIDDADPLVMSEWHDRLETMADSLSSQVHDTATQIDYLEEAIGDIGSRAEVDIAQDIESVIAFMGKHGIMATGAYHYHNFIDAVHNDMETN